MSGRDLQCERPQFQSRLTVLLELSGRCPRPAIAQKNGVPLFQNSLGSIGAPKIVAVCSCSVATAVLLPPPPAPGNSPAPLAVTTQHSDWPAPGRPAAFSAHNMTLQLPDVKHPEILAPNLTWEPETQLKLALRRLLRPHWAVSAGRAPHERSALRGRLAAAAIARLKNSGSLYSIFQQIAH